MAAVVLLSLTAATPGAAAPGVDAQPEATFFVDSLADAEDAEVGDGICATADNECTLRAAIMEAQSAAFPGLDVIDLSLIAGGVIDLADLALPSIDTDLTIQGPADGDVTIDGNLLVRHFLVTSSANLALMRVHLTRGAAFGEDSGGSIFNAGQLTLTEAVISASTAASSGGAIYGAPASATTVEDSQIGLPDQGNGADYGGGIDIGNGAYLTIVASAIAWNEAYVDGGGIYNYGGLVTVEQSEISSNRAAMRGGGFYNGSEGTARIVRSAITDNATDGNGGGAYNHFGELTLVNTTVSANSAKESGGGIVEEATDTLYLYNATITDNVADGDADGLGSGGGLMVGGPFYMLNSILAGNRDLSTGSEATVHPDCTSGLVPPFGAHSYNVVGDNAGCEDHFVDGVDGNQVGNAANPLDPILSTLTSQYGDTPLHAILASSPALDGGDPAGCLADDAVLITDDQRGMPRPQGASCDVGAYEAAWPRIEEQIFTVPEFSPNGTLVGVVAADDPNGGPMVTFAITGGNGSGDGAFAINPEDGSLTVADSSQIDPSLNPFFELEVTVTNSIGLTDAATVTVDVLADPLIVRNTDDSGEGSLRDAIAYANDLPGWDTISFSIPGSGPHIIQPLSELPAIYDPVTIDGLTQPTGDVIVDGSLAGAESSGLVIATTATVRGLTVQSFAGHGIHVSGSFRNWQEEPPGGVIEDNVITGNGGNGVLIVATAPVTVRSNSIYDNGLLGIDLDGDGVTPNDIGDEDLGANGLQNYPVLQRAMPEGPQTIVEGRLNSSPWQEFNLEFYVNATCDHSGHGEGQTLIGATAVATDAAGNARFNVGLPVALSDGQFITSLATDAYGNTSEFSPCIVTGPSNDSWPRAYRVNLARTTRTQQATVSHYVDLVGQSRWYKFAVEPDSQVTVSLSNLPANYDIVVYKDIAAVFASLLNPQDETDLSLLGAEFAPDMFAPDMFAPDMFAPDMFAPDMFAPDMFAPDMFAPDMFAPDMFAPDMFAPDMFAPDMFAPDMFAPDMFAPDMFAPDNFDPSALVENEQAYASAQLRSIVAFSALNGSANERAVVNTWTNTGDFYVRVRGRNGVASLDAPFQLNVTIQRGLCQNLDTTLTPTSLTGVAGNYKTIVLVDRARLEQQYSAEEVAGLLAKLETLKDRPEVQGVIVFVNQDARVAAANAQADDAQKVNCPQAKNLVADAIRQVVQRYRDLNPLEYVVIVGNDEVIPFFRTPDRALLAPESNYVPPVFNLTGSQASLRLNYVLSQDAYGAARDVSFKGHFIPVPDLAVGRLVETPSDMSAVLDAYLAAPGGVVQPASAFVSGYDFLAETAEAVRGQLEAGIGQPASALIAPRDQAPQDPNAWTADQLIAAYLGQRYDLAFLAGHFSASAALAADYATRMTTDDLLASPVDFANALIFSAGCHAGYSIVNQHGVPLVTREPDWAQAFASRGATLVAGTGYQYGHTDFIAYSEQIYLEFSKHLRYGTGPVTVGKALVGAKQTYLANTPILRGIDEKSLLETTLFGLPMLAVDLPTGRIEPPSDPSVIAATSGYGVDPGLTLGLRFADLALNPTLTTATRTLVDTSDLDQTITATYLVGGDALMLNPTEPVLPVIKRNVSVPGTVLRGVGFRSGAYDDLFDIIPLTSAAATEIRGIQFPYQAQAFYPTRPWNTNYYDVLANGSTDGVTRLMVIPAQFQGDGLTEIDGTLRRYSALGFRLFYSDNVNRYPQANRAAPAAPTANIPALAAPPAIVQVTSITSTTTIAYNVRVTSDPSVGVQEVWVTYTGAAGPFYGNWRSLDLVQDPSDTTLWSGELSLPDGRAWQDVRFIVQAVNGVGLVSMVTNFGNYFIPGIDPGQTVGAPQPTSLALLAPPTSGAYGTAALFSAQLTEAPPNAAGPGAGLANQILEFGLGSQRRQALTDANGVATVQFPLVGLVQEDLLRVSFVGSSRYQPSSVQAPFTIVKQSTSLAVEPAPATGQYSDNTNLLATLIAGDERPLPQRTVFFVAGTPSKALSATSSVITDFAGRALAGPVDLPAGAYPVTVYFLGAIPVGNGQTVILEDSRFTPSVGVGTLLQTAEDADVTYTGDLSFPGSTPFELKAFVVQDADGSPGNLTLAQVRYLLVDSNGQTAADLTGSVDANGNSIVEAPSLPAGDYQLTVQVVGGFFASAASEPIAIRLLVPTAITVNQLTVHDPTGQSLWLAALAAIAALFLGGLIAWRAKASAPGAGSFRSKNGPR